MATIRTRRQRSILSLATAYAKQTDGESVEFTIPEDLTALSTEELSELQSQANEHFTSLYGDGTSFTDESLATLRMLTDGIESLTTEETRRQTLAAERAEEAQALQARAFANSDGLGKTEADDAEGEADEPTGVGTSEADEAEGVEDDEDAGDESDAAEAITASAKRQRSIRVPVQKHSARPSKTEDAAKKRDMLFAVDAPGHTSGETLSVEAVAKSIDRRLGGFNQSLYSQAAARGQHLREQTSLAVVRKPFAKEARIESNDVEAIEKAFAYAVDQTKLTGGSLVAAGGWCAPSETLYDLLEVESRDGLLSLPEVNITRGGISFTTGPDFADIYANTGFAYTEAEDIAGDYDGAGGGTKPFYRVDCPPFEEVRLDVVGLGITAGLLQQRGYPEVIARTVRGALVAHDHKVSARLIGSLVAGSTAVTMPAGQVGTTAPLLTAIELQTEHYRSIHRMARSTTLEAVFPYWVHGAVRSDLSRRLGVDLIDVTDARIDGWFRARGIAPQFVYDWQAPAGAAGSFTAWPTTVSFLLYAAGTWVRGSADVINLDTIYDSVNLAVNDYTALFTEEGILAAKRGIDSRVVTVNISADGATAAGQDIAHDGSAVVVTP